MRFRKFSVLLKDFEWKLHRSLPRRLIKNVPLKPASAFDKNGAASLASLDLINSVPDVPQFSEAP